MQPWARPRRERRARGEAHPVYDFLFQYYPYSAGQLETWHPAPHEALEDSAPARERFNAPVYVAANGVIQRDLRAMSHDVRTKLSGVREMLLATRERAPNFGCFGMHEWAMVYRGHDIRHAHIAPLRLPQHEVDALVESRPVACSHFDAFRFFAPEAKPLNRLPLAYATRYDREQPGAFTPTWTSIAGHSAPCRGSGATCSLRASRWRPTSACSTWRPARTTCGPWDSSPCALKPPKGATNTSVVSRRSRSGPLRYATS
ncbi:hypothetical protein [Gemmatimonas sp.]|uniref:hypothetical protein n=1 Tax=Gemmatimonas sp. TaxID=1962908 RepID=UPI00333E5E94